MPHVEYQILDTVSAQRTVEGQNQERRQRCQPAQPLELAGQRLIGGNGALTGLAADGQLAHHNDIAAQNSQNDVHQQEGKTAVVAHLVGEAPDVAQTHSGADSRHQEAKCALKTFSFFHKSSLLSKLNRFFFLRNFSAGNSHRIFSSGG